MVSLPTNEPDPKAKETILRFESYVDNVLRVELQKQHKNVYAKETDLGEWTDLKRAVTSLREHNLPSFKGRINLGSSVYLPVDVPDTSKIIMHLGTGVYVEMSLQDALVYIDAHVRELEQELFNINEYIASLKARIQVMVQNLSELDNLSRVNS